jgi:hypothetical protein
LHLCDAFLAWWLAVHAVVCCVVASKE